MLLNKVKYWKINVYNKIHNQFSFISNSFTLAYIISSTIASTAMPSEIYSSEISVPFSRISLITPALLKGTSRLTRFILTGRLLSIASSSLSIPSPFLAEIFMYELKSCASVISSSKSHLFSTVIIGVSPQPRDSSKSFVTLRWTLASSLEASQRLMIMSDCAASSSVGGEVCGQVLPCQSA